LIDRDKPKEGVQMWAMPWTVDKDIATQSTDSRTRELLYVDDPDDGYDLYITREGTGARTKYTVKIARTPSPIELDDTAMDILENHPLTNCLVFHTYEHIAQVFSGKKPSKSVVEETPKATAKKAAKEQPDVEIPTYAELMLFDEDALFDLIEALNLDVDASVAESVEELQELVAKTLNLEKPKPAARRTFAKKEPEPQVEEDEAEEAPVEESASKAGLSSRLASLRNRNK